MDDNIAIKVEGILKSYKLYSTPTDRIKEALHPFKRRYHQDFHALQGIHFEVKKGETLGIVGKNGAGKSTLLKIITGVITPTQGRVQVRGRVSALLELGAGFNQDLSGIENIFFQASLLGMTRTEMLTKLDDILDFADIGEFIHQKVKTYSSGMFARLAFAVAIHVEPDILIVDEALSVGDAHFQLKCHKRMNELRAKGITILFVSHDTYSVKTLCSRALFLHQGTQVTFGHALDVVNDYLLYLDHENQTPTLLPSEPIVVTPPASITRIQTQNTTETEPRHVRMTTGTPLTLHIDYRIDSTDIDAIVFVFNLYRERDSVYVCGSTTLMDGLPPIPVTLGDHSLTLTLTTMPLLSGKYRLRMAINEPKGIGIITELNDALRIDVIDHHEAEGLVNLQRQWTIT